VSGPLRLWIGETISGQKFSRAAALSHILPRLVSLSHSVKPFFGKDMYFLFSREQILFMSIPLRAMAVVIPAPSWPIPVERM
jgi:hypothetical protein